MADPETYGALAESAWAWVLDQVRRDEDGLWLPENTAEDEPGEYAYYCSIHGTKTAGMTGTVTVLP